ncbi:hypothetical protein BXZ70DRAFT_477927 [Cristinia sonorae]|uniref:F-box domain-containing protein n=1 Tax=Cristinia sonorae TaxID=1940300 RepID=A0A8K0XLS3_9AGAR|nr:hypothetical protein BXZ70DRAFT_477927 [Cristinia sonorae]
MNIGVEGISCAKCSPTFAHILREALGMKSPSFVSKSRSECISFIDDAISECNLIVRAYQQITQKLHEKRNEYSVIHRVPDEILEAIFQETIEANSGGSASIIPVSQVCRRWRNLALDSPRLWRFITAGSLTKVDRITTFLRRTRSLPLSVQLTVMVNEDNLQLKDPRYDPEVLLFWACDTYTPVLRELPRIRHLSMSVTSDLVDDHNNWFDIPKMVPVPYLEVLDLDLEASDMVAKFVVSLTSPERPALRNLRIACSSFVGLLPLVTPRLTTFELVISDDFDHEFRGDETHDLVTALRSMPLLEVLKLDRPLPLSPEQRTAQEPVIALPRLREMVLNMLDVHAAQILECIQVPPGTNIHLHFKALTDPSRLRDALSQILKSRESSPPLSFDASFSLLVDPRVYRGTETLALHLRPHSCVSGPRGPLQITMSPINSLLRHVDKIWDALPLDRVHSLAISHEIVKRRRILPIFTQCTIRMTSLRELVLDRWTAKQLDKRNPFLLELAIPDTQTKRQYLFSDIQHLTLKSMNMKAGREPHNLLIRLGPQELSFTRVGESLRLVKEFLRMCEEKRGRLRSIRFLDCNGFAYKDRTMDPLDMASLLDSNP